MRRSPTREAKSGHRSISAGRQGLYLTGLAIQVIGGVGFLVGFVSFAASGMSAVRSTGIEGDPFAWWFVCLGSMVLLIVGGGLRTVAARGVAGAGLVLDPDRARRDLQPWARMGGGLWKDALDEAELGGSGAAAGPRNSGDGAIDDAGQAVKLRCRRCKALSPETVKYCGQCGSEL